jgi:hypothetical protein
MIEGGERLHRVLHKYTHDFRDRLELASIRQDRLHP